MDEKVAIKRLTASDLTFLKAKLGVETQSKQKAINLNADVFVDRLFPALHGYAQPVPLTLEIFGPGGSDVYSLTRKIVPPSGGYKNWRLNGEFVVDPEDQAGRFDSLRANDIAVLAFSGGSRPERLRLYFLAQDDPADAAIWNRLDQMLEPIPSKKSLKAIDPHELDLALNDAGLDELAPLRAATLTLDNPDVELAAQGDPAAEQRLARRGAGRAMSAADLAKAKERANQVGRAGELAVNSYLTNRRDAGHVKDFTWRADENAVAPYDFSVVLPDGSVELIDVKSTTGEHDRAVHFSAGEIRKAASATENYRVYRVSKVEDGTPNLRISLPIRELCSEITEVVINLPASIVADGYTIPTAAFTWEADTIPLSDDE
jgi:hypothetical protein